MEDKKEEILKQILITKEEFNKIKDKSKDKKILIKINLSIAVQNCIDILTKINEQVENANLTLETKSEVIRKNASAICEIANAFK